MRSSKLKRLLVTSVVGVAVAAIPALAQGGKRIAVLEVRGALSEDLGKVVRGLVAQRHEVVSDRDYRKAAKRLKAGELTDRNVARVAAKLGVEGVVHGWITTDEDDRLLLRLRVRNGGSGRVVKKVAVSLSDEALTPVVKRVLKKRVLTAISELKAESAPRVRKRRAGRSAAVSGDDENPLSSDGRMLEDDGEIEFDDGEIEFDDDEIDDGEEALDDDHGEGDEEGDSALGRERSGAAIEVGLSVMTRKLAFAVREGLSNAPTGYQGPTVPAIHLAGEIYPGLLEGKKGLLAKVGAGFSMDRAFGLETAVGGVAGVVTIPTTQMQYGFDVRYRHEFDSKMTLVALVGFNRLDFSVDKAAAPSGVAVDVPNTTYSYFSPGVELSMGVADRVKVAADGKLLLVTGTGEVGQPDQYGAGTVSGFDMGVGASYELSPRLTINATGRYMSFGFDFYGNGELSANRDGDPETVDVGGASDRYLGAYLTASYSF